MKQKQIKTTWKKKLKENEWKNKGLKEIKARNVKVKCNCKIRLKTRQVAVRFFRWLFQWICVRGHSLLCIFSNKYATV